MASRLICDICGTEIIPDQYQDRPISNFVLMHLKTQQKEVTDVCQDCTEKMLDFKDNLIKKFKKK